MSSSEEILKEEDSDSQKKKNSRTKLQRTYKINSKTGRRSIGLGSEVATPESIRRVHEARVVALKEMKAQNGGLPLRMGLATADQATRKRIQKMGGNAMREKFESTTYYKDIGRKGESGGGAAQVVEKYSVEFFRSMGKQSNKKKKNKKGGKGRTTTTKN